MDSDWLGCPVPERIEGDIGARIANLRCDVSKRVDDWIWCAYKSADPAGVVFVPCIVIDWRTSISFDQWLSWTFIAPMYGPIFRSAQLSYRIFIAHNSCASRIGRIVYLPKQLDRRPTQSPQSRAESSCCRSRKVVIAGV